MGLSGGMAAGHCRDGRARWRWSGMGGDAVGIGKTHTFVEGEGRTTDKSVEPRRATRPARRLRGGGWAVAARFDGLSLV